MLSGLLASEYLLWKKAYSNPFPFHEVVVYLLLLGVKSSLYILHASRLPDRWFASIFPILWIVFSLPFVFFKIYLLLKKIFFKRLLIFWETERDRAWAGRGRKRERGRHRIRSRFQVLSRGHGAWRGARTHKPWDHDLNRSRMLNRLSHPGAP